jgi:hypothetical protein
MFVGICGGRLHIGRDAFDVRREPVRVSGPVRSDGEHRRTGDDRDQPQEPIRYRSHRRRPGIHETRATATSMNRGTLALMQVNLRWV